MNTTMKAVTIALMLLAPMAAQAASPEDSYIAARDRYIAKLSPQKVPDSVLKQEKSFYADLEKQLRRIIGPTSIKGFSTEGKINLNTLTKSDQGFGMLDGLVFVSKDEKTRIVATNDVLFGKWLRQQREWWPKLANPSQNPEEALKSEDFFTQALVGDAAVSQFDVLPIAKPQGAKFAFAMLAGRSQDIGPLVPDEIFVTVIQGSRIFVASAPTSVEIKSVPACDALWEGGQKKASEIYERWQAGGSKDKKLFEAHIKVQDDASEAFHRCFVEYTGKADYRATLTAQAQALADLLPAK